MPAPAAPPTPPIRGIFTNLDGGVGLNVTINPSELSISRRAKWNSGSASGQQFPTLQFQGGEFDELELELLLDTTEETFSVLSPSQTIYNWTVPVTTTGRPPVLLFTWGTFTFQGVVEKVNIDYQRFDGLGAPKRATVKLSMLGKAFVKGGTSITFFEQAAASPAKPSV